VTGGGDGQIMLWRYREVDDLINKQYDGKISEYSGPGLAMLRFSVRLVPNWSAFSAHP
jgi:hypothetical protein